MGWGDNLVGGKVAAGWLEKLSEIRRGHWALSYWGASREWGIHLSSPVTGIISYNPSVLEQSEFQGSTELAGKQAGVEAGWVEI